MRSGISVTCCSFLFLAFLNSSSMADMFTPSHSCHKPHRPYEFTSEYEISSYNSRVNSYRRCIEEFADEQKDAANHHRDAAREAVEEWNSYVRNESLR
jgi:hypothetical protein